MAKNSRIKSKHIDSKGVLVCADCGSSNVETYEDDYTFAYGIGESRVKLTARIPIRKCSDCDFSFRDCVADDICHEAVCLHLGVMTPKQIKSLRKSYGLTQADFSKITKLGEATLSRWERGVVIHNEAYDNYLYLLEFPENLDRVCNRDRTGNMEESSAERVETTRQNQHATLRDVPAGFPNFRCVDTAA